jgi:hypothetical protein
MWVENYEKLNNSEKEELKRLLNVLLSKTFVIRDYFEIKDSMMRINPEYRFIERHFDVVSEYLSYSGWDVRKDNQYGVISLENVYEYNRVKLDRFTTLILYTIRLIFEEERERVTLRNEIMTTTGQIIHKMIALNIFKRKPPDREITDSLRLLSNHNIIQKISGSWENADTRILILPSILFVISNERISRMYELLDADDAFTQSEAQIEMEGTAGPEIIRGEEETE